jgi:hypothetical protein
MNDKLKGAVLLTIGRGGWTLYYPSEITEHAKVTHTLQGYGIDAELIEDAVKMGVPVVDNRTIPDGCILRFSLGCPMVNPDLTTDEADTVQEHGTSLRYCTVKTYIRIARQWGAVVR